MSRALLVLGPESSGTRMWTRLLIEAGFAGDPEHLQGFDLNPPQVSSHPRIVWRRSVPHAGEWPHIADMVGRLKRSGYGVEALVLHRDPFAIVSSQVATGHVQDPQGGRRNLCRAYIHIHQHLRVTKVPWYPVSFEAFVLYRDRYLDRLGEHLGIQFPKNFPFEDANAKWYR